MSTPRPTKRARSFTDDPSTSPGGNPYNRSTESPSSQKTAQLFSDSDESLPDAQDPYSFYNEDYSRQEDVGEVPSANPANHLQDSDGDSSNHNLSWQPEFETPPRAASGDDGDHNNTSASNAAPAPQFETVTHTHEHTHIKGLHDHS